MKRILLTIAFICSALFAGAQTAVKSEASETIEVADPYQVDNTGLVGTWTSRDESIVFNADGTCSYGTGYTYQFRPKLGTLIILDDKDVKKKVYNVFSANADYVLLNELGTAALQRYYKGSQVGVLELSDNYIKCRVGKTHRLAAGLKPSNAVVPTLQWSSTNERVATVDQEGIVTAKGNGTCTIIASYGQAMKATCRVSVITAITANGYSYVDLGLPSGTLWATCNVGATEPEGYGQYYAFGELKKKNRYEWEYYTLCKGTYNTLTKYCTSSEYGDVDDKTELELEDDVAHVLWGGDWRIPSNDDFTELMHECTWDFIKQNNVYGRKVTGPNGNSIFLPCAGPENAGGAGYYLSRSIVPEESYKAISIYFSSPTESNKQLYRYYGQRCSGYTIRPVLPVSNLE